MATEDATVVLLPGLDGTGLLFQPLIDVAPTGVRPVVVDYPPTSDSGVAALTSLVRDRQPGGPWLLVAESFSGPLAISIAASHPSGLRGLVLVATAARWQRLRWFGWAPLSMLFRLPLPTALLRKFLLGRDAPDELVTLTKRAIKRVEPRVLASRLRALSKTDATSDLRHVSVPVLYLEARDDRLVHQRDRASVLDSPIQVHHRVVPGPHFLLQVQPAQCWLAIRDFYQSQCAG